MSQVGTAKIVPVDAAWHPLGLMMALESPSLQPAETTAPPASHHPAHQAPFHQLEVAFWCMGQDRTVKSVLLVGQNKVSALPNSSQRRLLEATPTPLTRRGVQAPRIDSTVPPQDSEWAPCLPEQTRSLWWGGGHKGHVGRQGTFSLWMFH